MPQLTQLSDVILSQLFWLAITLGFIYFVIGRGMVPKILSTVDARDKRIADDLAAAERARADADATEEAYRLRMDASRAEASKLTLAAKASSAKATEQTLAKANAVIEERLASAAERINSRRLQALDEIQGAAADLTQVIVLKVAAMTVDRPAVEAAVAMVRTDA
ncbi:MAG: F-type H+-transporting ATPase subunit b [Sphingomonadales bacterium]|jgi:F-type H+-transporting ATPase subunit b|nr:F-type H+-transporting ATPase subunit b [Sphingomonadales bacterium]